MNWKEKLAYDIRYTSLTYADMTISLPIWAARGVYKAAEYLSTKTKVKLPEILKEKDILNSKTLKLRDKVRENNNTEPGVKYILSNLLALPPFYFVGAPIANEIHDIAREFLPNMSNNLEYLTNSIGTIAGQLLAGYTAYQIGDILQNSNNYKDEKGKLSSKKIIEGYWNTTKTFVKFDIPYVVSKTIGQSTLRALGKDPGLASKLFDSVGIPLFYVLTIPLGIRYNLIDNKETRRRKLEEEIKVQSALLQ